jgi:phosphate uptake regulator
MRKPRAAIIPQDDALDKMNAQVSRQLIDRMARDPEQLRGYINLMFIARHLERVGDHATNIGEDAVYGRCRRRYSPPTGRGHTGMSLSRRSATRHPERKSRDHREMRDRRAHPPCVNCARA